MTGNNGQPYMVLYAAMAAAMGGVLFGYDIGKCSLSCAKNTQMAY